MPMTSAYQYGRRNDPVTVLTVSEAVASYQPHNKLPGLPPSVDIETKAVLKKAISANKALAELRIAGELVPNQAILLRAIMLQEAKMSSEIENIVTSNDELYQAFDQIPDHSDPATKEVIRYEEALWHGFNQITQESGVLSARLFVEIARLIKDKGIDIRRMPGTRIANGRTGETIYTPPVGEKRIRDLLDDLSEYLYAEDDVDPLIKMAVAHYQFEAIHPFVDGNGRTGRILNILYLVERGLLDVPVLYLSRYIIQRKGDYYVGLRRVTDEDAWEDWVLYMLDAIEQTALDTKSRLLAIREALIESVDRARREMRRGYSKELIELIFLQPYTRISALEKAGIAKRDAASMYLRELERIGLLTSVKKGREVLYLNVRLMHLLAA